MGGRTCTAMSAYLPDLPLVMWTICTAQWFCSSHLLVLFDLQKSRLPCGSLELWEATPAMKKDLFVRVLAALRVCLLPGDPPCGPKAFARFGVQQALPCGTLAPVRCRGGDPSGAGESFALLRHGDLCRTVGSLISTSPAGSVPIAVPDVSPWAAHFLSNFVTRLLDHESEVLLKSSYVLPRADLAFLLSKAVAAEDGLFSIKFPEYLVDYSLTPIFNLPVAEHL